MIHHNNTYKIHYDLLDIGDKSFMPEEAYGTNPKACTLLARISEI